MDSVKQHVSAEAAANIERWLTEPKYAEYKVELEQMIANEQWQDLEDAFSARTASIVSRLVSRRKHYVATPSSLILMRQQKVWSSPVIRA